MPVTASSLSVSSLFLKKNSDRLRLNGLLKAAKLDAGRLGDPDLQLCQGDVSQCFLPGVQLEQRVFLPQRSQCAFHRGHEFITVHLQLFAVVAGLLPVQLWHTIRLKPAERREGQIYYRAKRRQRGGRRLKLKGQCSLKSSAH